MTMDHDSDVPGGLMPGEQHREAVAAAAGEMPRGEMPAGAMNNFAGTVGEMPRGEMSGARADQQLPHGAANALPHADPGAMPCGPMADGAMPMAVSAHTGGQGIELAGEWRLVLYPATKQTQRFT